MKDMIDKRNERDRIRRSVVKYWNVNYAPVPPAAAQKDEEKEPEVAAEPAEENQEHAFNATTGSYSGQYGKTVVEDEVTRGQIEKILHEKSDAIHHIVESGGNI